VKTKHLLVLTIIFAVALLAFSACAYNYAEPDSDYMEKYNGVGEPNDSEIFCPDEYSVPNSPVPTPEPIVHTIITFGGYSWRVLDVQDYYALILAENVIFDMAHRSTWEAMTWETSDIRKYLNGTFFNSFSDADRARIREATIVNDDNPWWGTSGGNDMIDRIFLLSIDEVLRYLGDSGMIAKGANVNERDLDIVWPAWGIYGWGIHDQYSEVRLAQNPAGWASWWWLRSPGDDSSSAAIVRLDGDISLIGRGVNNTGCGVRPALWLRLEP